MNYTGQLVSIMKNNNYAKLRINGGYLKGRSIPLPDTKFTRPTKSIIRESLFNHLGANVLQMIFIEAFAGSGSVGIEALSRGAKQAIFIEAESCIYQQLKENLVHLQLDSLANTHLADSLEILPSILLNLNAPAILYLDPPFPIRIGKESLYESLLLLLPTLCLQHIEYIIFEVMSGLNIPESLGHLTHSKERKFGKTSIHYYTKRES